MRVFLEWLGFKRTYVNISDVLEEWHQRRLTEPLQSSNDRFITRPSHETLQKRYQQLEADIVSFKTRKQWSNEKN